VPALMPNIVVPHNYFRLHCLHTVHEMRPIIATDVARSVVCVSVYLYACALGTRVSCAKTAKPIEMPFGGLTHTSVKETIY